MAFLLDILLLEVLYETVSLLWPVDLAYPWLVVALFYFVFWTGYSGQTLGKWALGLKVTDKLGLPIGYSKAIIRALGYLINLVFLGLGFLWIVEDKEKRGWHDLLSGTRVYKI